MFQRAIKYEPIVIKAAQDPRLTQAIAFSERIVRRLYRLRTKIATLAVAALAIMMAVHVIFGANGMMVYEELFGREGFSGPSSLLYHLGMPEAAHDIAEGPDDDAPREREQVYGHAHLEAWRLSGHGQPTL